MSEVKNPAPIAPAAPAAPKAPKAPKAPAPAPAVWQDPFNSVELPPAFEPVSVIVLRDHIDDKGVLRLSTRVQYGADGVALLGDDLRPITVADTYVIEDKDCFAARVRMGLVEVEDVSEAAS
jgi:hypothetical protein